MTDNIRRHGVVFMARYWLSSWLMRAAFAAMPPGRYAREVRLLLDGLNGHVADEVMAARAAEAKKE